ncbi:hypothetical protein B5M09_009516 [Aphanomyces astaci]|uniref:Macro domain-containing protein n=1 Tax=Aphanomyces astaci TaxID=112090 RepID=A0A3R7Y6G3_APHAT|nr:hypothetical protein B5M09_009516 [Aphanomyces astaci]
MAPSLVDCLENVGSQLFTFLGGSSLDCLSTVLASHAPAYALLLDESLWSHLYHEQFGEAIPGSLSPHHAFLHMSCHREWFFEHVHVVQGDLESAVATAAETPSAAALIFPTTPTLLHPHSTSAAGAVHKLGGTALRLEIERERQAIYSSRGFPPPGSAIHTTGGQLSRWFPHLMHCIGPSSNRTVDEKLDIIERTYLSALTQLMALHVRRATIIPIGTGIALCPVALTADVTMQSLWDHALHHLDCNKRVDGGRFPLDDVVVLCRDAYVLDAFRWAKQGMLEDPAESESDDDMSVGDDEGGMDI